MKKLLIGLTLLASISTFAAEKCEVSHFLLFQDNTDEEVAAASSEIKKQLEGKGYHLVEGYSQENHIDILLNSGNQNTNILGFLDGFFLSNGGVEVNAKIGIDDRKTSRNAKYSGEMTTKDYKSFIVKTLKDIPECSI
jgi:hypothetical protein